MINKLKDYYTDDLRIVMIPASQMLLINPGNEKYRMASENDLVIVFVMQGNSYGGFYVTIYEEHFTNQHEANIVFRRISQQEREAEILDFTSSMPVK